MLLAIYYCFFLTKTQFLSSAVFITNQDNKSSFNFLPVNIPELTNGSDFSPDQIQILFESISIQKQILEKFNFYNKYKLEKSANKLKLSLKMLQKDINLETTEKGSLGITDILSFSIKCYHTSPDTAYMMAQYSFDLLDSAITKISSSKANRTKNFIACQLTAATNALDSLQHTYNEFQKRNKAYEMPEQLKLTIGAYGDLNAPYQANEIKINSMLTEMQSNSPSIIALKKENSILLEKMRNLEAKNNTDILIGFNKYSDLFPQFSNLFRNLETQTKLVSYLTQQHEEAKIKEAKDISSLIMIDKPLISQYKERPKRILLLVEILVIYFSTLFALLSLIYIYKNFIKKSSVYNEIITNLKK